MLYNRGRELGKLIIQLAPTGIVPTKETNPSVPIFPDEIVRETYEAYLLGVSSVHIHARDPAGNPTGRGEIYEEIISGIRKKCPGIIICASTTGRIHDGPRDGSLDCNPDLASLMMGSVMFRSSVSVNTFEQISCLAKKMREKKIKPELEIFEPGFINTALYLEKKGILKSPLHFNFIMGSLGSISADIRDMTYLVDSLPSGSTWAAAGIGRFQMQIAASAILMGGHVRVGLEDSLYENYESRALANNLDMVRKVVDMARALSREIASPSEARSILSLPLCNE